MNRVETIPLAGAVAKRLECGDLSPLSFGKHHSSATGACESRSATDRADASAHSKRLATANTAATAHAAT